MYDLVDCDVYTDINKRKRYDISRCDFWWIVFLISYLSVSVGLIAGKYLEMAFHPARIVVKQGFSLGDYDRDWTDDEGNTYWFSRYYLPDHYQAIMEIMYSFPNGLTTNVTYNRNGEVRELNDGARAFITNYDKMELRDKEEFRRKTILKVRDIMNRTKW